MYYQGQLKEMKGLLNSEINQIEEKHVNQLESVEERVKLALSKKDQELRSLRSGLLDKELLCNKYEELLEKQRNDLLGNKVSFE